MQQRWWLLAVAVLGMGLAILLIPRPDTGEIPAAPTPTDPAPAPAPAPSARGDLIPGPPPGAEKVIAQRNRPSAKTARELAAPLGGVRYSLGKVGSEEAKQLSKDIGEGQQKLMNHTSKMDSDLDAIIGELAPHIETLKTTYADNPDIAKGVARYEKGVEAWNQSAQE